MAYLPLLQQAFIALLSTFIFAFFVILMVRFHTQKKIKQGLADELAKKDNFAAGISYAAHLFTVLLIIGYLFRHLSFTDIKADLLYGFILISVATAFSYIGKQIHNKWVLSRFNEEQEIAKRNVSAALIESGAFLGNALIILGLYKWSHSQSMDGLLIITSCFILLQFFLVVHRKWQEWLFANSNQGTALQTYLSLDNTALGLRFSSQTLALCMAIYAGLSYAPFYAGVFVDNILVVLSYCGILVILQQIISALFTRIALPKINTENEIEQQDNIGVACVELAIYLAVGLILIALFNR
ncbi:DUF350 domain-containing protein [Pseudoalteromonas tunicata]|jgi:uncharacterized membrane protein YjfL (UPF0719 family)|uniref:DUF350 domain-containing protein n=1 Tax=Pseudoalteromonas tunicata D2 TaxID=87626 RepID=A4C947_9GAMM|nr:DUF350 domain-containing protein [Pseudoalteromonas tunicata]ATC93614.1 hypothetical protein PTUN_a0902 [Pseudoalteromonas tunicata]AXT29450.1 hypothetical protein D1819_00500 [Pseudoalteromonas tunicata]EAR29112.1 hypothetical protein PTD2_08709 [Pseudoalteromonas tunicata D2]MDP4983171.1 hypothetical protein [Pseudoalteromonas tunicata]MDP5211829.1 hypothetical protein [Pseudoalteromonas tunicata]